MAGPAGPVPAPMRSSVSYNWPSYYASSENNDDDNTRSVHFISVIGVVSATGICRCMSALRAMHVVDSIVTALKLNAGVRTERTVGAERSKCLIRPTEPVLCVEANLVNE